MPHGDGVINMNLSAMSFRTSYGTSGACHRVSDPVEFYAVLCDLWNFGCEAAEVRVTLSS
jgi:hypothetical protein